MTDPQAEAVAALAGAIADHDDICSRMAIPECSDLILAAIQQDPAARAALVAVLAPPSPEPLRAALALLLTATDERTDCYEHADNCCSDWCESCKRGRIAGRCLREARKKARAALAHTEPAPEGEPHPDPLWRVALANTEAYVRGHWDGLHCDAKGFGGILDECEHVGRIYEPRAATPPSPAPEGDDDAEYRAMWAEIDRVAPLPHPEAIGSTAQPTAPDLRAALEQNARLQDALDALDMATLWLHRTADFPHMPSHQAESWERKARSGRVALRAALAATPAPEVEP